MNVAVDGLVQILIKIRISPNRRGVFFAVEKLDLWFFMILIVQLHRFLSYQNRGFCISHKVGVLFSTLFQYLLDP
jgi:hypothetical protein